MSSKLTVLPSWTALYHQQMRLLPLEMMWLHWPPLEGSGIFVVWTTIVPTMDRSLPSLCWKRGFLLHQPPPPPQHQHPVLLMGSRCLGISCWWQPWLLLLSYSFDLLFLREYLWSSIFQEISLFHCSSIQLFFGLKNAMCDEVWVEMKHPIFFVSIILIWFFDFSFHSFYLI